MSTLQPNGQDSDKENEPRPAKRAKISESGIDKPKKLRRSCKKIALLSDLPKELFYAVCEMLSPLDLVNLSLCCKVFNCYISKGYKSVWKTARANEGIPETPMYRSERRLAVFLFVNKCQSCGERAMSVNFQLMVRYCKKCRKMNICTGTSILDEAFQDTVVDGKKVKEIDGIKSLALSTTADDRGVNAPLHLQFFDKTSYINAVRKYINADEPSRSRYMQQRGEEVDELTLVSIRLEEWAETAKDRKKAEREEYRKRCRTEIKRRLLSGGFQETVLDALFEGWRSSDWHKCIRNCRAVTDRTWTTLLPKLREIYDKKCLELEEPERVELRLREAGEHYKEILQSVDEKERRFMPSFWQVALAPRVKQLARRDYGRVIVTKEEWDKEFLGPVVTFMAQHENLVLEEITSKIRKAKERAARLNWDVRTWTVDGPAMFFKSRDQDLKEIKTVATLLEEYHAQKPGSYASPSGVDTALHMLSGWYFDPILIHGITGFLDEVNGPPLGLSMTAMCAQGEAFVCTSCAPELRKSRNWPELVRHFYDELAWYQKASSRKRELHREDIPIVLSHRFTLNRRRVISSASYPSGSCAHLDHAHQGQMSRKHRCKLCGDLRLGFCTMYEECMRVHFQERHGRGPLAGEFVTD